MKRTFRLTESHSDPRRDVGDEIRFHLDMRAQELIEQGLTHDDAWREARRQFGDIAAIEAECREERLLRARERDRREWFRGLAMDLRYAGRSLRTNFGFTIAAVLTLGLGIGAAAAVFTVVDGVLLRPLPYADPSRLQMVWLNSARAQSFGTELPLSAGFYVEAQDAVKGLAPMAAFRSWPFVLGPTGEGIEPERVAGSRAEPALFATLGVRPLLGRTFTAEEAVPGAPRVAVISYSLWQRRFGGAQDVVGRMVTLSGERYSIVGVMPRGFAFPRGAELPPGLQFGARTEIWAPLVLSPDDRRNYGTMNLSAVARLAPGTSPAAAGAEVQALGTRLLPRLNMPAGSVAYRLVALEEQAARPVRRGLLVLLGAVGFVLLIACTNVANLLIGRTGAREREFAVRAALGAGQFRIMRQLITENVVLALGGAAVGGVIALWGSRVMLALVPGSMPRADDVGVDIRVIGFTLLVALFAGAVFGIAGAVHVARQSVAVTLQNAATRLTGTMRRRFGRRLIIAAEVALSVVLLVGAGLLAGSFARLQRVTPGFDSRGVLTASVLLPVGERFDFVRDGPRWSRFFDELTARVDALPGVRNAGAVSSLPLSGAVESGGVTIEGRPTPAPANAPNAEYSVVAGDYFGAMGIGVISGRVFDSRDRSDAPGVVIINREFARRHFPGESAVGRRIRAGFDFSGGAIVREVIGVVENVRQTSLDAELLPAAYVPASQMPYPFMSIVVRADCSSGSGPCDPSTTLAQTRRELAGMDPSLALADVRPLAAVFESSIARQRFSMAVLGVFAVLALVLALVGLYGVIALSVGQRRREIGVRMALGAQSRDVLALVLGEGLSVTLLGVLIGLVGALALSGVLRSLLFDVSATDPRFFGAAAALVAVVALAATYIPARRALRVDPTAALRDA
ncbi:MAG TPA: ABC transporter permease [Gemmatimonadaceae bacterium]|nr:ABC transporter permease [Gemmatimonadaceae bacterium]